MSTSGASIPAISSRTASANFRLTPLYWSQSPRAEDRPGMDDVTEGPEPLVGEPVVVAPFLLLGQPDPLEGVAGVRRGEADRPPGIHHLAVRVPAAVGDPDSPARPHD